MQVQGAIKLVGSYINVEAAPASAALNLTATADARVHKATVRLPRIGRLPMGMAMKARQARSLAASVCTTGTDIQAPSAAATKGG